MWLVVTLTALAADIRVVSYWPHLIGVGGRSSHGTPPGAQLYCLHPFWIPSMGDWFGRIGLWVKLYLMGTTREERVAGAG